LVVAFAFDDLRLIRSEQVGRLDLDDLTAFGGDGFAVVVANNAQAEGDAKPRRDQRCEDTDAGQPGA
jgi:hypothetical protein